MTERELLGGRYEVIETISAGPRATVLRALDREYEQPVVLKVFPATSDERDKLPGEARVLRRLAPHRALPVVRNDFRADGAFVLVMDWIEGKDLQEVLDDEGDPGLALADVLRDLEEVASALDHLHAQVVPVVHGDVKPDNLVRAIDGQVYLVDFDIAGSGGSVPSGTPGFVAPEVAAGDKPQPASDIYGLAATVFALLNGRSPTAAGRMLPGTDAEQGGPVASVLSRALSADPAKRPGSAGELIDQLRRAARAELPAGEVAFLAYEVAKDGQRDERSDETRTARERLGALRDEIAGRRDGLVFTFPDESALVFRDAAEAARAAVELHDGVARSALGVPVQLKAAVLVADVRPANGRYGSDVLDQLMQLRDAAEPGTTIAPLSTAALLIDRGCRDVNFFPLTPAAPTSSSSLVVLRRPGTSPLTPRPTAPAVPTSLTTPVPEGAALPRPSRWLVAGRAFEHPVSLGGLTVAGLAVIFRLVLASELHLELLGTITLGIGLLVWIGAFAWCYILSRGAHDAALEAARLERDRDEERRTIARERAETRRQLHDGFESIQTDTGAEGLARLESLAEGFDALEDVMRRSAGRATTALPSVLLQLAENAYREGMSALSEALKLLSVAEGPGRRGLEMGLEDIEDRLAAAVYKDPRARQQDEERLDTHRKRLARHEQALERARDLMFQAERCATALESAHFELVDESAGDTEVTVDAVIETLQETIKRVRDVHDAFRKSGF